MKPTVAVTMWRRQAPTFLYDETYMHTLVDDYVRALDRSGVVMLMLGRLDAGDVAQVLDRVDGLVITGGGDFDPARYGAENTHSVGIEPEADQRDLALARFAQERQLPVLGICRGLQAVNIALGGTLHQEVNGSSEDHPALADTPDERNTHRHAVHFDPESRLTRIYGATERKVNSLHHQGVARLGSGLKVAGTTSDGGVEALEAADPDWPLMAVQWHPEMLDDPAETRLFEAFVEDADRYRRQRS